MLLISLLFISIGVFFIWNSYKNIKFHHEIAKEFVFFKGAVGLMSTVVGIFSLINFLL